MLASKVDAALLLLRVGFGGMMAYQHGWPKLQKLLANDFAFADPLGLGPALSLVLAVFAEFVCALLVVFGIATRAATIPLSFTMLVAVFIQHAQDPLAKREMGLLYLCAFLAIFVLGPGPYALSSTYRERLSPRSRELLW